MNILYARKSSESEERQVLSIPAQMSELRALAERRGERIDLVLEESRSAREPGRAVFGQLLKMIEGKQVASIYAWRLDRLARNPVDGGLLIHHIGRGRISRIVTPEGAFSGSGNDKLMMQIHFGMATKYVDDLAENVRRGNREVFKSGRITGRPPIGYLKSPADEGFRGRGARQVVPDPSRFNLVARLWKLMLTGTATLGHIREEAEAIGLRTRGDRRHVAGLVSISGISAMFHNRFYCGEVVGQNQVFRGTHPPMVTPEEFDRVQKVLAKQRQPGKRWSRTFAYSGFLRCGSCGRHMVGEEHVNRHGSRYVYYRCTRKKTGYARCAEPYVAEKAIDQSINDVFGRFSFPPKTQVWLERHIEEWGSSELAETERRNEELRRQIGRKEAAIKNLTSLVVHGDIAEDEFRPQRAELLRELEALRSATREPTESIEQRRQKLRAALALIPGIVDIVASCSIDARRVLVSQVVDSVSVSSRVPTVYLRPNLEILFGLAVRSGTLSPAPSACIEPPRNPETSAQMPVRAVEKVHDVERPRVEP